MRLTLLSFFIFILVIQNCFSEDDLPVIEATTPVQINANLIADGDVIDFQISPDNQTAVYLADQSNDEVFELYSVQMDGSGTPIKLSVANPVTGGDVLEIVGFSADGQRVIYSADQVTDEMDEILSVKLDGTSRITLTPSFGATNSFSSLTLTPDKTRVIYVAATSGGC